MLNDNFSYIGNYICREAIRNLYKHMTELEVSKFSNSDFYYLTVIYHLHNPKVSQVADELGLTKPAISVLIKKFARMGLLKKVQSEEDRRVFHLAVTEKGKNIAQGDETIYSEISSTIMSLLENENQYKIVDKLLSELVFKLQEKERVLK